MVFGSMSEFRFELLNNSTIYATGNLVIAYKMKTLSKITLFLILLAHIYLLIYFI